MRHGDLFSGIGGFALAAQWVWGDEYENVFHSEIDDYAEKVYHKRFPTSKCLGDIRTVRWEEGQCDLLTGGFPCQPYSFVGKRKGKSDDRALWHEMFRAVCEIRPHWVLAENVAGIINMELDDVLADLESAGYETQTFVIPACAVGAPHRRDRVWIVANRLLANAESERLQGTNPVWDSPAERCFTQFRSWRWPANWWATEPRVGRVADGVPNRVDRLRALGNAIVPQVAFVILSAIRRCT